MADLTLPPPADTATDIATPAPLDAFAADVSPDAVKHLPQALTRAGVILNAARARAGSARFGFPDRPLGDMPPGPGARITGQKGRACDHRILLQAPGGAEADAAGGKDATRRTPMLRAFSLFHLSQIEGDVFSVPGVPGPGAGVAS